ncbi:hypothetical protein [Lactococcus lactis]|uniref:hypothetical protein n=1 Tax=Lactococcus lactis TaxID=1358 RepID=UPI0024A9311D|nr:hypothetical protein [Lactococcus lactis]
MVKELLKIFNLSNVSELSVWTNVILVVVTVISAVVASWISLHTSAKANRAAYTAINQSREATLLASEDAEKSRKHEKNLQHELFIAEREKELKVSRPIIYSENNNINFWIPSGNPILDVTIFRSTMENKNTLGEFYPFINHETSLSVDELNIEEYLIIQYTTSEFESRFNLFFPIIKISIDVEYTEDKNKTLEALIKEINSNKNPSKVAITEKYIRMLWGETSYVKDIAKTVQLERNISGKMLFNAFTLIREEENIKAIIAVLEEITINKKLQTETILHKLAYALKLENVPFNVERMIIETKLTTSGTDAEKRFCEKWREIFIPETKEVNLNLYIRDIASLTYLNEEKNAQISNWLKIAIHILLKSGMELDYTHGDNIRKIVNLAINSLND